MEKIAEIINGLIENFTWQGVMDLVTFIVKKVLGFVAEEEGIDTTTAA